MAPAAAWAGGSVLPICRCSPAVLALSYLSSIDYFIIYPSVCLSVCVSIYLSIYGFQSLSSTQNSLLGARPVNQSPNGNLLLYPTHFIELLLAARHFVGAGHIVNETDRKPFPAGTNILLESKKSDSK